MYQFIESILDVSKLGEIHLSTEFILWLSMTRPPHAVVVPFPAQGHVTPLMHFAKLLAARGFFVSFINTEWTEQRIFKSPNDSGAVSAELQKQGLKIRFLSLPDGLPPDHPRLLAMGEYFLAMHKLGPAMVRLLQSAADEAPPITCIVTDCFVACTYQVATELAVPRVIFWTYCSSAAIALANSRLLMEKGYIPINAKEARRPENRITCLPGKIPPLLATDLQTFFRVQDTSDSMFKVVMYESDMQNKADYALINVFEELEGPEAAAGLSKGYPALPIGPVFLPEFLEGAESSSVNIATSLWKENLDCLKWLDTQAPSSVLYVSFGSIAVVTILQLQELALGLEASQQPFLWVVRRDMVEGKSAVLPEGYADRVKGRGMLVEWAPQLKVLSHPSVGGFLTHNGWNSTSESISMGVPMIGWPLWAEQFHNCRFCKEIWKIGMDLECRLEDENVLVTSEEIEKVVRALMTGPEGIELRKNAAKLKDAAMKAVLPGGSSYRNLDKFTEDMTARANA